MPEGKEEIKAESIITQSHQIPKLKEIAKGTDKAASEAQYELAWCYGLGIGTYASSAEEAKTYFDEALSWLAKAKANGHSESF